jgi:hypothetical protein
MIKLRWVGGRHISTTAFLCAQYFGMVAAHASRCRGSDRELPTSIEGRTVAFVFGETRRGQNMEFSIYILLYGSA